MKPKPLTPPRPMKPFRSFLPERLRRRIRQGKVLGKALKEESTETNMADAFAIVIDNTCPKDKRAQTIKDLIKELSAMRGDYVVDIAVASD
jgi:hypothetical protein